jgi:hypothetical protein
MQLNKNSISAKLYRWFYNQNVMPNNLCPYFWKLVLMWITILPFILITLPAQIITKFDRKTFGESIGYTFAFYFVSFALMVFAILPISFFTTFADGGFWDSMRIGSILFWGGLIILALYYGIKYLFIWFKEGRKLYDEDGRRYYGYDSERNKIYYKTKKPNIIAEFIKAKYNKYCPKIDWNDEGNNN